MSYIQGENRGMSDIDKYNNSIDVLIALTVQEISATTGRDMSDVMEEFMSSRTAKMLSQEDLKLWWNGPSDIAQMYKEEKSL